MSDIRVRGTTDPAEIAAVLAILRRDRGPAPAPVGITAWRRRRRAALASLADRPKHEGTPSRL